MTTASDMIYKLVNCATGFKKPEAMGAKKSMNTESDINPYINGSFDWCPDLKNMKEFLPSKIRQIKLYRKNINTIDKEILRFIELEELSLCGNLIHHVENKCLPSSLKIMHLNGNELDSLPNLENLIHLIHLGLSHNSIRSTLLVSKLFPSGIVSLDLSWNKLVDLKETAETLNKLSNLKNLILFGNPICLLPSYNNEILRCLPKLIYFDEKYCKNVPVSNKISDLSNTVSVNVKVCQINFTARPLEEVLFPEAKEEFEYSLAIQLEHYDSSFETSTLAFKEGPIDVNFLGTLVFSIDEDVRDKLGVKLNIKQSRYNITTVQVGPTPKGKSEKGKKAKEEVEIVKTLVSVTPLDSMKCSLCELLEGKKSFTRKVAFEGLATVDLEFSSP